MRSCIGIVVLVIATVFALTTLTASAQDLNFALVPVWKTSTIGYAWFIDDRHVLIGDVLDNARPRADVTFNPKVNYVVYATHVAVYDAKTGNKIWEDTPPAGTFRVAKPKPDGTMDIVLTISFDFAHNLTTWSKRFSGWATPYGIVVANDTAIIVYDYSGNIVRMFRWEQLEDYGYYLYGYEGADNPALDSMFVSHDGDVIVWQGAWASKVPNPTGEGDDDVIVFDKYLKPIFLGIDLVPHAEPISINDNYIITASNEDANELIVIDYHTGNYMNYTGIPVTDVNEPVYMSLLTTVDGKYIFAIKMVDKSSKRGALEVWKWTGGTSIEMVEYYNLTINVYSATSGYIDDLQPMSFSEASFSETYPYGVLPCGVIYYDSANETYKVVIVDDTIDNRMASISPSANYALIDDRMYVFVLPDIQSGEPRIRFHGDLIYNPTQSYPWELSSAFIIEAPKGKPYHIYFESGIIKITYVSAEERPVELITDCIVNCKVIVSKPV